jgi:hypothetical protein
LGVSSQGECLKASNKTEDTGARAVLVLIANGPRSTRHPRYTLHAEEPTTLVPMIRGCNPDAYSQHVACKGGGVGVGVGPV